MKFDLSPALRNLSKPVLAAVLDALLEDEAERQLQTAAPDPDGTAAEALHEEKCSVLAGILVDLHTIGLIDKEQTARSLTALADATTCGASQAALDSFFDEEG